MAGMESARLDLGHDIDHEPPEMPLAQPVAHTRGQQEQLIPVPANIVIRHNSVSTLPFPYSLLPVGFGWVDHETAKLDHVIPKAKPRPNDDKARQRLTAAIADIDFALPGSIAIRKTRCGKTGCRCKADPPVLHGPYIQWTRRVAGKTVTRLLSQDQLDRYQPWFANARRLRQLTAELEALSARTAERIEGWSPHP